MNGSTHLAERVSETQRTIDRYTNGLDYCPCCEQKVDPNKWCIGVFGDPLCRECLKREEETYPEVYADPACKTEAARRFVASCNQDDSTALVKIPKRHRHGTPPLPVNQTCGICDMHHEHRSGFAYAPWYDNGPWICRRCYAKGPEIEAGQLRLDEEGIIFFVQVDGDSLLALYPYGTRECPKQSSLVEVGGEAIWHTTNSLAWGRIEDSFAEFESHVSYMQARYANHPYQGFNFTSEDIYDTCLEYAVYTACRCHGRKPWLPYFRRSASLAALRRMIDSVGGRRQEGPTLTLLTEDEYLLATNRHGSVLEALIEEEESEGDARWHWHVQKVVDAIEDELGPERFAILMECLVKGREQADVAREFQVTTVSLHQRFHRARKKCRKIIDKHL